MEQNMGDAGGGGRGQRNLEPDLERGSDSGDSEEEERELATVDSAQLARELGIDIRGISKMAAKGHSWSREGCGDEGKGGGGCGTVSAAGKDGANMAAKTNADSVHRAGSSGGGRGGVLPQFCVEETSYNEGQVKLKLKTTVEKKSGKGKTKTRKAEVGEKKRKKIVKAKNKMNKKIQQTRLDPGSEAGDVTNNNNSDKDPSHQESGSKSSAPCTAKQPSMESCVGLQLQFDPSHATHGGEPVQVSLADVDAVVNADVGTSAANGIAIQQCGVMVQAGGNEESNTALDNLFQAFVNSGTEQLEMESLARSLMNESIPESITFTEAELQQHLQPDNINVDYCKPMTNGQPMNNIAAVGMPSVAMVSQALTSQSSVAMVAQAPHMVPTQQQHSSMPLKQNHTNQQENVQVPPNAFAIDTSIIESVLEVREGEDATTALVTPPAQQPGFGYQSYAHNFGPDALVSEKESDTTPNGTSDEQDQESLFAKTNCQNRRVQGPEYTVATGYSPKVKQTYQNQGTWSMQQSPKAGTKAKKSKTPSQYPTQSLTSDLTLSNLSLSDKSLSLKQGQSSTKVKEVTKTSKARTKDKSVTSTKKTEITPKKQTKQSNKVVTSCKVHNSTKPKIKGPKVTKSPLVSPSSSESSKSSTKKSHKKVDNSITSGSVTSSDDDSVHSEEEKSKVHKTKKTKCKHDAVSDGQPKVKKVKKTIVKVKTKKKIKSSVSPSHAKTGSESVTSTHKVKKKSPKSSLQGSVSHSDKSPGGSGSSPLSTKSGKVKKKKIKKIHKGSESTSKKVSAGTNSSSGNGVGKLVRKKKKVKTKVTNSDSVHALIKSGRLSPTVATSVLMNNIDSDDDNRDVGYDSSTQKSQSGKNKKVTDLPKLSVTLPTASLSHPELLLKMVPKGTKKNVTKKVKSGHSVSPSEKSKDNDKVVKKTKKVKCKTSAKKNLLGESKTLSPTTPLHIDIPDTEHTFTPIRKAPVTPDHGSVHKKTKTRKVGRPKKNSSASSASDFKSSNGKKDSHVFAEPEHSTASGLGKGKKVIESSHSEGQTKHKEQTPSPQSATTCISDETLFSDSGIGTDNNSNPDQHLCDKRNMMHAVPPAVETEVTTDVLNSHPLATSNHGLYSFGKREKFRKMKLFQNLHYTKKRKRKCPMSRMLGRLSPTFLFEVDSLTIQLAGLSLVNQQQSPHPSAEAKKPSENYLSSIAKLNTSYSSYLRPSYLATALRYKQRMNKHKKKKRDRDKFQFLQEEKTSSRDKTGSVFGVFEKAAHGSVMNEDSTSLVASTQGSVYYRGNELPDTDAATHVDPTPRHVHSADILVDIPEKSIPGVPLEKKRGRKKNSLGKPPLQVAVGSKGSKLPKRKSTGRPRGRPRKKPIASQELIISQLEDAPLQDISELSAPYLPSPESQQLVPIPKRRGRPPKNRSPSILMPKPIPRRGREPKSLCGKKRKGLLSTILPEPSGPDSVSSTIGESHPVSVIEINSVEEEEIPEITSDVEINKSKTIPLSEQVIEQPVKVPKRRGRPPGKSKKIDSLKPHSTEVPVQTETVGSAEKESFIQSVTIAKRKGRKRGPKKGWKKNLLLKTAEKEIQENVIVPPDMAAADIINSSVEAESQVTVSNLPKSQIENEQSASEALPTPPCIPNSEARLTDDIPTKVSPNADSSPKLTPVKESLTEVSANKTTSSKIVLVKESSAKKVSSNKGIKSKCTSVKESLSELSSNKASTSRISPGKNVSTKLSNKATVSKVQPKKSGLLGKKSKLIISGKVKRLKEKSVKNIGVDTLDELPDEEPLSSLLSGKMASFLKSLGSVASTLASPEKRPAALAESQHTPSKSTKILAPATFTVPEKSHEPVKMAETKKKSVETKRKDIDTKKKEVEPKKKEVETKKKEVETTKKEVEPKKKEVEPKKKEVETKKKEVETKKKEVETNKREVETKKKGVETKKKEVEIKKKEIEPKKKELESKKKDVGTKKNDNEIKKRDSDIKKIDNEVKKKDIEIKKKVNEIKKKEPDTKKKDAETKKKDVETKKREIATKKKDVEIKKNDNEPQKKEVETKKSEAEIKKKDVETKNKEADTKKKDVETKKKVLETKKKYVEPKKKVPETKKKDVETKKKDVETKKKDGETKKKDLETKRKDVETNKKDVEMQKKTLVSVVETLRTSKVESSSVASKTVSPSGAFVSSPSKESTHSSPSTSSPANSPKSNLTSCAPTSSAVTTTSSVSIPMSESTKMQAAALPKAYVRVKKTSQQVTKVTKKKTPEAASAVAVSPVLDESSIPLKKRKLMKEPPPQMTEQLSDGVPKVETEILPVDKPELPSPGALSQETTAPKRKAGKQQGAKPSRSDNNLKKKKKKKKKEERERERRKRRRRDGVVAALPDVPPGKLQQKQKGKGTGPVPVSEKGARMKKKPGRKPKVELVPKKKYWRAGIYSDTFKEELLKKKAEETEDEAKTAEEVSKQKPEETSQETKMDTEAATSIASDDTTKKSADETKEATEVAATENLDENKKEQPEAAATTSTAPTTATPSETTSGTTQEASKEEATSAATKETTEETVAATEPEKKDDEEEEEVKKSPESTEATRTEEPAATSSETVEEVENKPTSKLLPFPFHAGINLCEEWFDFELPYDIWWQWDHNKLPPRTHAPKFKKIRNNIYFDVKPTIHAEVAKCSCRKPCAAEELGCGDDCLNRLIQHECSSGSCPCDDQCSNQIIQRHQWAPGLRRFMTVNRGWGVKTTQAIRTGSFIIEYLGEVISVKELWKRALDDYQYQKHHYCLNLDGGMVIDGYRYGNEARFVNHSCNPNCEMQKWMVNGLYRIGMFALREIHPGEELTYDYNFHSFNMETQQECNCGHELCRGYIGGRAQKPTASVKKTKIALKRTSSGKLSRQSKIMKKNHEGHPEDRGAESNLPRPKELLVPKPMSFREMNFVADNQVFLLRNIERVKRIRERLLKKRHTENNHNKTSATQRQYTKDRSSRDVFMAQFTALKTSRSVKTRRLAAAQENTEVTKAAKLAQVFKDIYTAVCTYRNASGQNLAIPFMNLPSRKRNPDYYKRISDPVDLSTIEKNLMTGKYKSVEAFDSDFLKVFKNSEKYNGKRSDLGKDAAVLRKVYHSAKAQATSDLQDILEPVRKQPDLEALKVVKDPKAGSREEEEEEVIRCLCGLFNDEGLMIQCETCLVWQHCDCVGIKDQPEHYVCEQCDPRPVPKEIVMIPQPKNAHSNHQYFLCLQRDDTLMVKQGDCAYLAHENQRRNPDGSPMRTSARIMANTTPDKFNIFRVEKLWKNENGEKFVFGHHFLRPHETHHTPSRKFFRNELFRVPLYEIIRLEAIVGLCCVMDLAKYCRGRPKGVKEQDVYICEYRLDRTAHLFSPIGKLSRFPICTKRYAFDRFEKKLIPKRDYTPHYIPEHFKRQQRTNPQIKSKKDKTTGSEETGDNSTPAKNGPNKTGDASQAKEMTNGAADGQTPMRGNKRKRGAPSEADREHQRGRLDNIMLRLLSQQRPSKQLDVTYLLEQGKKQRKRTPPVMEGFV